MTAVDVWRRWAAKVSGIQLSCGHMVPEHAAPEVLEAHLPLLAGATPRR